MPRWRRLREKRASCAGQRGLGCGMWLLRAIASLIVVVDVASSTKSIHVGVIIIRDSNTPYDYKRTAPAIDLAARTVNSEILAGIGYKLDVSVKTYGPKCNGNAASGRFVGCIAVFLGCHELK